MNAKILTVVVGLLMLVPAGFAANNQFGDCPSGYDCEQSPQGDPFPPDAVTGHTVYAKWVIEDNRNQTLGLPTDFAAVAGYFADIKNATYAVQRECVVWFNGKNLDQQPATTSSSFGFDDADNSFPSDEDEQLTNDTAYQDYDFDRDINTCEPWVDEEIIVKYYGYAVVVEKGDCNPADGGDFRYRGHLDFVDPNGIYHEVQEYDYVCQGLFSSSGPAGNLIPGVAGVPGSLMATAVEQLFPWTYQDAHNQEGCQAYVPADPGSVDEDDPANSTAPSVDAANATHLGLGHKCNGSIQDLFTERLWITPIHDPVWDPTVLDYYTFALQVDTCSGINIYEQGGKKALGANNNYEGNLTDPGSARAPITGTQIGVGRNIDSVDYTLDQLGLGQPLVEVCHDGSSFSFDDTPRGRTVHAAPPEAAGDEEIMRGNSYDFDGGSTTAGKHRENCRANFIDWPYNDYPGRAPIGEDCYPEDHKTAQIDIYVFDYDPTEQFVTNTNAMTGNGTAYTGGTGTGPDGY